MLDKMVSAVSGARVGPLPRRKGKSVTPEAGALIHERRKAEELRRMRLQERYFTRHA